MEWRGRKDEGAARGQGACDWGAPTSGEVWYNLAREASIAEAEQSVAELRGLGIEFVDAGWKLTRAAAGFKAKHKMSYADCFAAALAKEHKAELVTGDPEFQQVEGEVKILWAQKL